MASNFGFHKSVLYLLEKRARFLGNPNGWDWILQDPIAIWFIPSLYFLHQEGFVNLSDQTRKICKNIYLRVVAKRLRRQHYIKPIINSLEKAGIDVIPLKGSALVETHYMDFGLRPMTDIDILVRAEDYFAAGKIILANGMNPKWQSSSEDPFEIRYQPEEFWPGEFSFKNEHGLHLDLHQNLVTSHWFSQVFPIDMMKVWEHNMPAYRQIVDEPASIKSLWTRMLSPMDMLAHSCLHLAMHGLQDMQNFLDLDLLLRNLPSEWDWSQFLALAKSWKIVSTTYHAFIFCQYLFETPIPAFVIESLTPNIFDRWPVKMLITPQAILKDRSTLGKRYPTLVKFALFDGGSTKLRAIHNLLFPNRSLLKNKPDHKSLFHHWLHVFKVLLRGD
ncbi:nucleotidyltransferase family protein [Chloroflexota bacterium]